MEQNLAIMFEKKVLDTEDVKFEDYIFKGIRCTDEVMYRLCYFLTEFLGLDSSILLVDEEDSQAIYKIDMAHIREQIEEGIFDD